MGYLWMLLGGFGVRFGGGWDVVLALLVGRVWLRLLWVFVSLI